MATLAVAASMAAVAPALGQTPPAPIDRHPLPPAGPIVTHELLPTVYWAQGGVGNVGILIGDTGVVLVDATISPASAAKLTAAIAQITPKPIKAVILTHRDIDHVGGLAGLPAEITIVAQAATAKAMEDGAANGQGRPASGRLPTRIVENQARMTLCGIDFVLRHWAPAHTDGDLVIVLPKQKIAFTGDIFAMDQPRALIHQEEGGSSAGWVTSAKGILAMDADRFVVGHGDVQTKASLAARIRLVEDERARIVQLVDQGNTLAQVQTAVGDPPPGATAGQPGGPRFTPFSQIVYQELKGRS